MGEGIIIKSVNEQVVHGMPGDRVLKSGDIVSLDMGATVGSFHGDAAITVGVGGIDPKARRLLEITEGALTAGISAARSGSRLGDISAAIQAYVESRGFSAQIHHKPLNKRKIFDGLSFEGYKGSERKS